MGLTSARVAGPEAVVLGLATHLADRHTEQALIAALINKKAPVGEVIERHCDPKPVSDVERRLKQRAAWFEPSTVGQIARTLGAASADPDAAELLAALRAGSPHSLAVTLELLRAGAQLDLAACLQRASSRRPST